MEGDGGSAAAPVDAFPAVRALLRLAQMPSGWEVGLAACFGLAVACRVYIWPLGLPSLLSPCRPCPRVAALSIPVIALSSWFPFALKGSVIPKSLLRVARPIHSSMVPGWISCCCGSALLLASVGPMGSGFQTPSCAYDNALAVTRLIPGDENVHTALAVGPAEWGQENPTQLECILATHKTCMALLSIPSFHSGSRAIYIALLHPISAPD